MIVITLATEFVMINMFQQKVNKKLEVFVQSSAHSFWAENWGREESITPPLFYLESCWNPNFITGLKAISCSDGSALLSLWSCHSSKAPKMSKDGKCPQTVCPLCEGLGPGRISRMLCSDEAGASVQHSAQPQAVSSCSSTVCYTQSS